MAEKTKNGDWVDATGSCVPQKYVPVVDKKRDALVEKLMSEAVKTEQKIMQLKEQTLNQIDAFMKQMEALYDMNVRTTEGNKRLSNFSNTRRVELIKAKYIDFDERLLMAKTLIDECIKDWGAGSNDKIMALIEQAFNVNEHGRLNKDRIIGLLKLKFNDVKWKKAMGLIQDSIKVVGTKDYIRFAVKDNNGVWKPVVLDIARC